MYIILSCLLGEYGIKNACFLGYVYHSLRSLGRIQYTAFNAQVSSLNLWSNHTRLLGEKKNIT
jgi:hypothetical protein